MSSNGTSVLGGPCTPWITGADVAACGADTGVGSDTALLDGVAADATYILFEISGRQFAGECETTRRPCRNACSCFGSGASLGFPWYWSVGWWGGSLGMWGNECGDRCGCGSISTVKLAGYPVREILEVKIGGEVLPEFDAVTGARNYRLDGHRKLVRMDAPGPPVVTQRWPSCQNMALDDDQPGTFAVTYTYGADVPPLGMDAAAQLARELWNACNGRACALPSRVTKVVRTGISMDLQPIAAQLRAGNTGLALVDSFIAASNSAKLRRRPMVWSPDMDPYARKVGE